MTRPWFTVPVPKRMARGLLVAAVILVGATCRLSDLIGTPKGALLAVFPVAPDSLIDSAAVGSTALREDTIRVTNEGGGELRWTARTKQGSPWLLLPVDSGTAPTPLVVQFDPADLANGMHYDTVVVQSTTGGALEVPVRLEIHPCRDTPITLDDSIADTLTTADCGAPHFAGRFAQLFRFSGIINDSVTIEVPAGFDAYVALDTALALTAVPFSEADDCLGTSGNPCLYYQRLPRNATYYIEVTSAVSADTGPFLLRLLHPRDPNAPASLSQRLGDSTTVVTQGDTINQTNLLVRAILADPDLGDSLHLEAEVVPVGQPFSGPNVPNGPTVGNGQAAWINLTGLADNTSYLWRVRARDYTGRDGPWADFGGSPSFRVAVPHPPNNPTGLGQSKPDGTPIALGAASDTDVVRFSATVNDQDPGDQLRLQVEVQPIGINFSDSPTDSGQAVSTGPAEVRVQLGNNTSYHWQARVSDQTGRTSGWVRFGGNPEPNGIDFRIALANVPNAPTALAQFQSDGTTPISVGGVTQANVVVLRGVVSDPDVGQQVQLEVEVLPVTQPTFTNTPNFPAGALVANGATASVTVGPLTNNTDYHWQARAKDATGRPGAWVSFPSPPATPNPETQPDFRVQQPPTQLVFTVQPPATTVAGVAITPAIQVTARDINGNTSTGFTGNVTMTIDQGPVGGTLGGTTVVAANAGVATFGNLILTKSGTYVLRATTSSPSLTQTSNAFNITPAATSQLVFTTQPSNAQAGVAIVPAVVVTAQDAFFNTTPSFGGSVTLTIATNPGSPPGTLTGGGPVTPLNGMATFNGVSINKTGVGYTLRAGSGALTPGTSTAFTITHGPATQLAFIVQPVTTPSASFITPAVQVEALDANLNRATSFTNTVIVAIGTNPPGNGVLSGTLNVPAMAGVSTFSNLSIAQIGTGYTLTANSVPLVGTTSTPFNIITSPISPTLSTVVATTPITACVAGCSTGGGTASLITVTARDGSGNPVQGATVVLSATGTGNTLTQPATTTNASGVATGTLSSTSTIDLKVVSAVISSVTIAQTDTVTVNHGPAATLVFTTQPGATTAGVAINSGSGGVVVTARDALGNTATSYTANVTMVIAAGPVGGVFTPTSTTTVPAAAGVATFTNLRIRMSGPGYQLQASSVVPALTSPLSNAFTINPAPPNQLAFTIQPTNTAVLARIDSAIGGVVVTVQDSVGNTTPTFAGQVRIILGTSAGGTLTGGGFITPTAGVATFPNLTLNVLGTYSLVTTSTGPSLISDESVLFDIIPGPAKTLDFLAQQPTQTVAGQIIMPAVRVTARDIQGNVATGFTGTVTAAIGTNGGSPPGTLSGTLPQPAVSGVATFGNLSINNAGPGYTLTASTPALPSGPVTGATSNSFNIIAGGASASQSTVSATSPIIACSTGCTTGGGTQSLITVTARDNLGNPIAGATVTLAAIVGTSNNITQPAGTTGLNGQITGTLSSTLAQPKTVQATITVGANPPVVVTQTAVIVVNPAPASTLLFTIPPNNTVATQPIRPATGIQVEVRDQFNNRVTSASNPVTVAILNNPGNPPGILSGTPTLPASGGLATFNGLSIDKVGTGYTLLASAAGLTADESVPFNINVGAATKLGFLQQPTSTGGGATISPPITVEVQDAGGNRTSGTNLIGIAILSNPSGGTLSGDASNNAVSGLATFNTLSINNAGTGYTLQATATGLTSVTSSLFNITVGGAVKLGFVQQPTQASGGATISPAVTVEILDAGDNRVNSTATVILAIGTNPGPGAALLGTTSVPAVAGLATFSNLSIDSAGTGYTLVATSGILTQATSNLFNITVGAATKLGFVQQPTQSGGGGTIAPAITVAVQDAGGNRVTTATNTVGIAILNNAGGGTLSGDASNPAVSGVATFGALSIDSAGTGYTLRATSGGLTGVTSNAFNIIVGPPSKLAFGQQPTSTTGGATISPAGTVRILDAGGNLTSATNSVTLSITSGTGTTGASLSGGSSVTVPASGGVATFSTLSIDSAGTGYTLDATSGGLTGTTSNAFNITVGAAAQLAFDQQPTNASAGAPISPPVTVRILDAGGNLVTGATNTVDIDFNINAGPGNLANNSVAAVGGVATFDTLSIDTQGNGYRLVAKASGLTDSAPSDMFNITP